MSFSDLAWGASSDNRRSGLWGELFEGEVLGHGKLVIIGGERRTLARG